MIRLIGFQPSMGVILFMHRQRRLLLLSKHLMALVLAGLLAGGSGARAADDPVLPGLSNWHGREVSELTIEGLPAQLKGQAKNGLAMTPRRKLLKKVRARISTKLIQDDAQRLRLLLARNGYPDATLSATGQADGENHVKVVVTIVPGAPIVYGQVEIVGLPAAAEKEIDDLQTRLPQGQIFTDEPVQTLKVDLFEALQQAGYAQPTVDMALIVDNNRTCQLTYTCVPGYAFKYQDFIPKGAPEDLEPLVHKTVGLEPGTPYTPEVAAQTRRFLRDLQLFRQIRITSEARNDTLLDLMTELTVSDMITADASVGSFSDNPLVVRASIVHRNLFDRARGAGLGAVYSTHLRNIEARTWWQALIARRSVADLKAKFEIQDEDSYRLDKYEIEFSNLFRPWRLTSLRLGIKVSNGKLDNRSADEDAFLSEVGLQTVLFGTWFNDSSDNPMDPSRGRRLTLQTYWSPPGFWTDSPFASVRASGTQYFSLGNSRTLATRLDGAVSWPLGEALDVTPDRRWFAGGVSTMRGYNRRMLGPLDSNNNPVGGQVRALAGLEVRQPVWSMIGVAVFLDSGQVWSQTASTKWKDMAVAGGVGLLFGTPIGPIRIDYAVNITEPDNNQPQTVWQFGIGHPY